MTSMYGRDTINTFSDFAKTQKWKGKKAHFLSKSSQPSQVTTATGFFTPSSSGPCSRSKESELPMES